MARPIDGFIGIPGAECTVAWLPGRHLVPTVSRLHAGSPVETTTTRGGRCRSAILVAWLALGPGGLSPPWESLCAADGPRGTLEDCGMGRESDARAVGDVGSLAAPAPPPLTTQRLRCILKSSRLLGRAGFIYAWSPHMPLSVKGLTEAATVAAARGLVFIPVLDPYADPGFVRRLIEAGAVTRADTSPAAAGALLEQSLLHHFPSLLVFTNGQLRGPSWPGYHRPAVLEHYLMTRMQ